MPSEVTSTRIIRELLAGHNPVGQSECESMRRILTLVGSAKNPFSRDHFHPGHLTASGVVVDPDFKHTLLIFHTRLQRWLQPGGHFEPGESDPSVAAAREVLEETSVTTRWPGEAPRLLDVDVHEIPARKTEPTHFHFDLRMLLVAEKGEVIADEVAEARWVSPDEFDQLDLDPGLLRALKKIGM